ncbi:hypothetical protein HGRIS_003985 [Hohenbuehelia grisea]|uniref:Glucose-methanol-choline oxidoreductase N-terminal domain-containing protein n=1 Tax=Hohenbuehelia grisea TaxID=104357 RepID=A0ABR3JH48_9AGAR
MASNTTYDIIFAGGGAAACVAAGRLAAADPSLKILILEAGPHTRDLQEHVQPARFLSNLVPASKVFTFHVGQPSLLLNGRSPIVPSGKCVGGGSSVNFVMYTRAAASDYDDWENVYDNPGWGSKDMIPLLKKLETYQDTEGNLDVHGKTGPIKISRGGIDLGAGSEFLRAALAYDKARSFTNDTNDFSSVDSYGSWLMYIDRESGRRSDAAHHYIYNQESNKNLEVQASCSVVKVLFEGTRAVGVQYINNGLGLSEPSIARATKLVVVSAGAFGSPGILQRSGIGSGTVLMRSGVQQLVDLPGVGQNYQDHNISFPPYLASEDSKTLDGIFQKDPEIVDLAAEQWYGHGQGLLATNGIEAGGKLRPTVEELKELGPAFEQRWNDYFVPAPDKPVVWVGIIMGYVNPTPLPRGNYISAGYYTEYPASTGHLHITSATDPFAPLFFEPGFLKESCDLPVLRWGYKKTREIIRRMAQYRGEVAIGHPQYAEDSAAKCCSVDGPVEIDAPEIKYNKEDDEAIDRYHRDTVATTWHSLGTCAMKPRAQGGVVDSKLNVYGVENLKVADVCHRNLTNLSSH